MSDPPGGAGPTDPTIPISTESGGARHERAEPTLGRAELVAGRYKIVRFLARGGGGEVYLAEDAELGGTVALKTLAGTDASDPVKLERFRREIHLARRVTDPHVCRIYDVGRHQRLGRSGLDVLFLTMEYLPGETLAARLEEGGRMTEAEALPLARHMATALDAAHRAGVVHRDFKSGNVLLVPSPEEPGGLRAVVTDFGLARARTGRAIEHAPETVTSSGLIVGTPSYMAPEQVEGSEITPAVDVYAFGVVLFEMVTGAFPFTGSSPLSIAVKRLHERAPSPRVVSPGLDPAWERVILRCLEREPGRRYARAGDAARELETAGRTHSAARATAAAAAAATAAATATATPGPARPRPGRRGQAWLAAATAIGLLVAGAWLMQRRSASPPAARLAAARPAVAVLGFRNATGREETAWLSTAFAEMLSTELAAGGALRLVPGETVAQLRSDLGLGDVTSLGLATLAQIHGRLATDYVVTGSYVAPADPVRGPLRLDLRLQDTRSGETIESLGLQEPASELFRLVQSAGRALRVRFGVAAPSADEALAVRTSLPRDPEAARLYAQGLEELRRFEPRAARDALLAAVRREENHALAHSALAEAWSRLGYDAPAAAAARRAVELAGDLPRAERLLVEARQAQAASDWPRAIDLYRSLWTFFPDDLEHGLRLAEAETASGRPNDAYETLTAVARAPGAAADPRLALAEARAAMKLGAFDRQLAAAGRAVAEGRARRSRLLAAAGLRLQGQALRSLGRIDEAEAAVAEAAKLSQEIGDREGMADALRTRAIILRGRGQLDEARDHADRALATHRALGNQKGTSDALNTVGNILYQQNRLAESAKRYEEGLAIERELDNRQNIARFLGNLANVRYLQGDLEAAISTHRETLEVKNAIGDKTGQAATLTGLGTALAERGELDEARSRFEEALSIARSAPEPSLEAFARYGLAEVLYDQDDLAGARREHQEGLAIRLRIDEKGEAADSRLALARVTLAEGDAKTAAAEAAQAAAEFAAQELGASQGQAESVRAEALFSSDPDAARQAAERALALSAKSEFRAERLATRLRAARVLALLGGRGRAGAVAEIERCAAEAQAGGLRELDLEARLVRTETATPRDAAGLAALREEAKRAGYARLARAPG